MAVAVAAPRWVGKWVSKRLKLRVPCSHTCSPPAGHRQTECPKKAIDVYRLPDAVQAKVEEQYARVSGSAHSCGTF